VSSNPYGQDPQQPGNYEDYSQGYGSAPQPPYGQQPPAPTGQPAAPAYGQTNYEQLTYGQSTADPYGQPYTQQYGQAPGYGQQQYGAGIAPYTPAYDSNPRPSVTMIPAVKLWLKNWKNFSGRASRSEYWWVALASAIVMAVIGAVLGVISFGLFAADNGSGALIGLGVLLFYGVMGLVSLAALVPSLSLGVRRLHDTNQSGWMWLINFIPSVGPIILLVLMAQASNPAGARFDDAAQPLFGPESI